LTHQLSAFCTTADEALRELEIAKKAWIDAAIAEGKPIPPPTYRPVIYQFSEQYDSIKRGEGVAPRTDGQENVLRDAFEIFLIVAQSLEQRLGREQQEQRTEDFTVFARRKN